MVDKNGEVARLGYDFLRMETRCQDLPRQGGNKHILSRGKQSETKSLLKKNRKQKS